MNSANSSHRSNDSVISEGSSDTNISVKLRRLKIEENVISKSIPKTSEHFQEDNEIYQYYSRKPKNFFRNLKDSFIEIKNLFEDIKSRTNSQCNLEVVDVDEVKSDVLDLESKIKSFKTYLEIESSSLKFDEKELTRKIDENYNEVEKIKRKPKVQVKPYNDVVPSPVKAMMNSPFKCPEVQNFQEFMANSKNRYGGWIAYNHNIFEQTWRKYFHSENVEDYISDYYYSENIEQFIEELLQKIHGIRREDIILHHQWYSKYSYLKERQTQALEKWRNNKKLIKKVKTEKTKEEKKSAKPASFGKLCKTLSEIKDEEVVKDFVSDQFRETERKISEQINSNISRTFGNDTLLFDEDFLFQDTGEKHTFETEDLSNLKTDKIHKFNGQLNTKFVKSKSGFNKPTEQWINKCNGDKDSSSIFNDIEQISKLRTPVWRVTLKQN